MRNTRSVPDDFREDDVREIIGRVLDVGIDESVLLPQLRQQVLLIP